MTRHKNLSRSKKILLITTILFLVTFGAMFLYVNDYYHASATAQEALESSETVTITTIEKDVLAFIPKEPIAGLIFYPGGKVESTSYAPLMHALAKEGILCLLPEMTFNLAVFEINAAEGLSDHYLEIDNWYIGGHSLGGSMAASYLAKNASDFEGLLLCAAYSTSDLSNLDLNILSIYGSEDKVMNLEKYETCKTNLPKNFTEYIISGGCHAYFGSYGAQDGDGTPTIPEEEQLKETVDVICNAFIYKSS